MISIDFQPLAAAEGYAPDCYVTSSDVPVARPSPSMIYMNMINLGQFIFLNETFKFNFTFCLSGVLQNQFLCFLDVWNSKCVVKVDDSDAGIVAGLHAGCWTVGIAKTVSPYCSIQISSSVRLVRI